MTRNVCVALAALSLSLGAVAGVVLAEPLAKEECDKLQAEQTALTAAGAREQLGRGAEWGKANLSPAQLKSVERYIVLEEQLSFRCGLAKLRASLPIGEDGGEQELDEKGNPVPPKAKQGQPDQGKDKAKAKLAPKAPAKDKAAAPTAKKADAKATAPAKSEAQPSGAKAAAKAKTKADDAYRPPQAKESGADPSVGSPAPSSKKQ
ncbi:MAG: hypothetical protein ABWZ74_01240 [Hyphomicrobiaceae bacterium]|jgi:hypothetical protein